MDLRTQTSLIASLLSLALALSVLLRQRKRRVHWQFSLFAANVAAWYLTTFLAGWMGGDILGRINLACAIVLPLSALQFFRAFIAPLHLQAVTLRRTAWGVTIVLLIASFSPLYRNVFVAEATFVYVLVFLCVSLAMLLAQGRTTSSRFERARLRYLALIGTLAATFTLADYLPYVGLDIPPVGTVFAILFLYILSQSILRERLLDLFELVGRLGVLTTLSFTLAFILWILSRLAGGPVFIHVAVAALFVLVLFDPIRTRIEERIGRVFFRERYELERTIVELRSELAHVLELEDLKEIVLEGLERSRRVTHAAIYLLDVEMRGYHLAGHLGPSPVVRLESGAARPLLDRLWRDGVAMLEAIERELQELRERGEDREAETLFEVTQSMEAMHCSVCVPIYAEKDELYGLLCVRDERLRDAFSPEEVQLLRSLAGQAGIAVENSRLYQRLKDRDRLAAVGEMAAGIAHEIRNPLGAIKASAQYLAEELEPRTREFLDVIVEEVDRLNRVVSSFLDYARPASGQPVPTDVNRAVKRTIQLLAAECLNAAVTTNLDLEEQIPSARVDVEELHQVLINLVQNAVQAMENGGTVSIRTRAIHSKDPRRPEHWVEIRIEDTGSGIPKKVLQNLFVPFVTTKTQGTGLGLAISQRIVNSAGGTIRLSSEQGIGTTCVIRLPSVE